ncbi:MAG TPA: hypothetical protein VFS20_13535 [Longimicrobium sp.]|nr:hypothetical protein [Longimicrobium sp.]
MKDNDGVFARLFERGRITRELLSAPGVWVPAEDLERGDEGSERLPAVHGLCFLRRIEPGSELPDGVDPDAARYDVVVRSEMSPAARLAAAAVGAVTALASAAALVVGVPWGVISLLAGFALIAVGVAGENESVTFRRSENGGWVQAEAELPAAEPLPHFAPWERVLYGTLSAAFVAMMLSGWIEGNLLLVGAVSAGLAAAAVWDSLPIRRRDPNNALVAELRFRELANPARPLTPEDLGLGVDGGARPALAEPQKER